MRRIVKNKYSFEKLYSQGLSISTPLNIDYQIQALKSLRKGIEDYDMRRGWRGPIINKLKNKDWEKIISQYKLDPTLDWQIAEIISVEENNIKFKIIDQNFNNQEVVIIFKNLKWTLGQKKETKKVHKVGDIFFIKKSNNFWKIKQYPKVNGGIVVINPFTGDVLSLVGGFNFKKSEFNRVTQAKRQPGSAFKPVPMLCPSMVSLYTIILDAPFEESRFRT